MSFAVGSLVRAREREWVVLPGTTDELVMVRPLGASEEETTGILPSLEEVESATFALPSPDDIGDYRSAKLLRDALRLGFRSSAGPFRSFGSIAVDPRPYQIVPLLMALRLVPVRLLIADDVGIGKTIEAALVARELLDQGSARRLAVLCPPHLAEQWQRELADKFHIEAEPVLASTAGRLERDLPLGKTIFDIHPYVVVSTDFIKSDRRRDEFLHTCPELVIVDEAHTCVTASGGHRGIQQRHQLVSGLARDPDRHLILVTATPHSGKEEAFRSLLELLDADFTNLPDELGGDHNRRHRERLARHLVQRRRADIRSYLNSETPFPTRFDAEVTYQLSADYRRLFDRVLALARESVRDAERGTHRMRVRYWSALALLRALASSPVAAAATLRVRSATADTETAEEADEVGRSTVLDLVDEADAEILDVAPGADPGGEDDAASLRRRLLALAREADQLAGDADEKMIQTTQLLAELDAEGFRPIVFCRFIDTAEYLAEQLRARLPKGIEVTAVTGRLAPAQRQDRVERLAAHPRRVLVATDCLSEGINLQDHFDAVLHYDLPWNPTRLEQREGRVDRFGQSRREVRVITYYGADNQIDETVLDVLLRKHRTIRKALGVSIPVPGDTSEVIEALTETVLLRQDEGGISERLPGMDEYLRPSTEQLLLDWDNAAEHERQSRSLFAQHTIKPEEVAVEVDAARSAVGSADVVAGFVADAVQAHGGFVHEGDPALLDLAETPIGLRDASGLSDGSTKLKVQYQPPASEDAFYLSRTSPFVSGLASYVLDSALDTLSDAPARRAGVIRTEAVRTRTTLLVVRFRFQLLVERAGEPHVLLAEDAAVLGFEGSPDSPSWLNRDIAETLLDATPSANVAPMDAGEFIGEMIENYETWRRHLEQEAERRGEDLLEAHLRVREAGRLGGRRPQVEPKLPPDVLGIYVLLPTPRI